MPEGVYVEVDGPYARVSFPDPSKKGPGIAALLATGAPIEIDTSGQRAVYVVPEGNAREAGLVDYAKGGEVAAPADEPPAPEVVTPEKVSDPAAGDSDAENDPEAKKAPVKKAAPKKAVPSPKENA